MGEGRTRLVEQLDGAANAWLRMTRQLEQAIPGDETEHSLVESLSPAIARQFREVGKQMKRLNEVISKQVKKPRA